MGVVPEFLPASGAVGITGEIVPEAQDSPASRGRAPPSPRGRWVRLAALPRLRVAGAAGEGNADSWLWTPASWAASDRLGHRLCANHEAAI